MSKKKIFVIVENQEEFNDIMMVCEKLFKEKKFDIYFIDISELIGIKINYKNYVDFFKDYKKITKISNKNNVINKLFAIYKIKSYIFSIVTKKSDIILLSGVPLVFVRYLFIFYNLKLISYLRSIIIKDITSHSLSHNIFNIFNKFKINSKFLIKLINPWECFCIFTIGEINKKYLSNYISENKIIISGPLLLDELRKKLKFKIIKNKKEYQKLIFATSAFEWHQEFDLDVIQMQIIDYILSFLDKNNFTKEFIIRVHPKDNKQKYKNMQYKYENIKIKFDETSINEFVINNINNSILVSLMSNLNIEWSYLGGKSIYVVSQPILKEFENFFNKINYMPYLYNEKNFLYGLLNDNNLNFIDAQKIYTSHKEGNIEFFYKILLKCINK